jgi:hypothetical protein
MKNKYLPEVLNQIEQVSEEVKVHFSPFSPAQLNWKPSSAQWSIAQCLDHLMVTNKLYFGVLKDAVKEGRTRRWLEKQGWVARSLGKMMVGSLGPEPRQKMRSPSSFRPEQSEIAADIVFQFLKHNEELRQVIETTDKVAHDGVIVTSPASKWVVLPIQDAIRIIGNHELRHLRQARRVAALPGFPKMIDRMKIETMLLEEHSKAQMLKVVDYIGSDSERMKELVDLILHGESKLSQRAAWALPTLAERKPDLLEQHLEALIDHLSRPEYHDAVRRNVLKVLNMNGVPDFLLGKAVDQAFRLLADPKAAIAIKYHSMCIIWEACQKEPDLTDELVMLIEDQMPHGSAGFKSKGKKILKAARKKRSLRKD